MLFRSAREVSEIADHLRGELTSEITAILRPTFPDNSSEESLTAKVKALREHSITDIDFYLLDAMRPRDLGWISRALTS